MNTEMYPQRRINSIDVFRGMTIFIMIFINDLIYTGKDIPTWLNHMPEDANAMTFADIIFPAFLFIVGMAIPFATQIRLLRGSSVKEVLFHSVIRAFSLITIGFFMVNTCWGWDAEKMVLSIYNWALLLYLSVFLVWFNYPASTSPLLKRVLQGVGTVGLLGLWYLYKGENGGSLTPQWWGILGQIGWVYLIVVPLYLYKEKVTFLVPATAVLFGLYFLLNSFENSANPLLNWFYENRRNSTQAGMVMMGIIMSKMLFHHDYEHRAGKNMLIYAMITLGTGFVLWTVSPISKNWATPSWGILSIFFCIIAFGLVHWLVEVKQFRLPVKLFVPAGNNALLIYIIPFVLENILGETGIPARPELFSTGWMAAIWSLGVAVVIMILGTLLDKRKIRLKL